MSFLSNKFKLETKSLEPQVAKFITNAESIGVCVIPDNSNTAQYATLGATNYSNIEAFFGLHNNGMMNTIATFNTCNINFYGDTVVRGNLIVDGIVLSLGLDIAVNRNDLHIESYNNCINVGCNVILQKYQQLTDKGLSSTSNAIMTKIYASYSNLYNIASDILSANSSDESTSLLNMNNQYDETKFDDRLATKTADDLREGTNKKYIVNNKFPQDRLIVKGDLWTSNIQIGGNVNLESAVSAMHFYGDGSRLRNVYLGSETDRSTNVLIEGSNLFFKDHYVGDLCMASNIDTSNFIADRLTDLQSRLVFSASNLIEDYFNVLHNNLYENVGNASDYLDSHSNELMAHLIHADADASNLLQSAEIYASNLAVNDIDIPLQVYAVNTSNQLVASITYDIADASNYLQNINEGNTQTLAALETDIVNVNNNTTGELVQVIYDNFTHIVESLNDVYGYSNIFEYTMHLLREDIIAYVQASSDTLVQTADDSYVQHSNMLDTLTSEHLGKLLSETVALSNLIYNSCNALYSSSATDVENASNYLIITSNMVCDYLYNMIGILNTEAYRISQDITDVSITIDNSIKTEFSQVADYADATSNELMSVLLDTINNQLGQSAIVLSQTNQSITNRVNNLTTDDIPEAGTKLYYTETKFNEFFSDLDYNMIANGTSNRFIVDDVYNSNLYVGKTVYASNLMIYGSLSTIDTDVYQTGHAKIVATNTVALDVSQTAQGLQSIMHLYNANDADIMIVKNTGLVGIGTSSPAVALDVAGDVMSTSFAGDASALTNVSLADKNTNQLTENPSALYFTSARATSIAQASNINVSNYISALSDQVFQTFPEVSAQSSYIAQKYSDMLASVDAYDADFARYNTATSNYFANLIDADNSNLYAYVDSTSNEYVLKIENYTSNQSVFVDITSNAIVENIYSLEGVQSNTWVSGWSNTVLAHAQTSNANLTVYISITSNNVSSRITSYNLDVNQSNYVRASCNFLLNHIGLSNFRITQYIQGCSNEIARNINVMSNNMANYLRTASNQIASYATGVLSGLNATTNVYSITDVYGGDKIVHMNFNNMKIINNVDDDNFMIFNKGIINPVSSANISSLTTLNTAIAGYESSNNRFLNSSNNIYVYNQSDADAKTVLDMMHKEGFVCHFLFRTRYTMNTPIYYVGNNTVSYVNIKVLYGNLYITLGTGASALRFYVNTLIIPMAWYAVDIVCYIIGGQIMVEVFFNKIMQNITMILPDRVMPPALLQTTAYPNSLSYAGGAELSMMFGTSNLIDTYEDTCNYTPGGTFTNTYWSSNSYINVGVLAPIIRSCAYDYQSFSNLIFSSYYASNYDYQYSSNIPSTFISPTVSVFSDSLVDNRLLIAERSPITSYFHYVLTEVEANVRLGAGYYFFMLDLVNEVSADILLGKQTDSNLDNYFNVANYYNSNQLLSNTTPSASIIASHSNFTTVNPLYLTEGYYRIYSRMFRTFANRNNNYFISSYYYTPTWTGAFYILNNSNIDLRYMRVSDLNALNTAYITGRIGVNRSMLINNNVIGASSNLYVYSVYDSTVYATGNNITGQLGINSTSSLNTPANIETGLVIVYDTTGNINTSIKNINQISAGGRDSLFLEKNTGKVYGCGYNDDGQLGINSTTQSLILVPVRDTTGNAGTTIIGITQISTNKNASSDRHSLFLHSSGIVYACGMNNYGQLGINSTTQSLILVPIRDTTGNADTTIKGITQVSAGALHSLFLHSSGIVYSCGWNNFGQLGINSTTQSLILVPVRNTTGNAGTTITGITQVSAGALHSLFLHSSGIVYACGYNDTGQLGINTNTQSQTLVPVRNTTGNAGTTITGITQVSAGYYHSLFLHSSGIVYASGSVTGTKSTTPSWKLVLVRDITGTVGTTIQNIIQVSAGNEHSLFLQNSFIINNISNYNYNISHSNLPYSFFAGNRDITSNLLNIQDFKIYNNPITMGANYSINNVLYTGKDYFELKTTNKLRTNRWQESSDYSSLTNQYIYYNEGNVGIGNVVPATASLEINTNNLTRYNNTLINSLKTNNGIWTNTGVITSSDARIKTNIRDIDDSSALNQILQIEPKTYNYIDTSRDTCNVIGFIAQQVRDVIPTAVKLYKEAIPNIYTSASLSADNIITVAKPITVNLQKDTVIILLDANNNRYTEKIQEVISNTQFRIYNDSQLHPSNSSNTLFVYGTIIQDFHALDKSYIYTLNICALQDIYRRHQNMMQDFELVRNYEDNMPAKIAQLTVKLQAMQESLSAVSFETLKDSQKQLLQDVKLLKYATEMLEQNLATYDPVFLESTYSKVQALQDENSILASSNQQLLKEHNQLADTIRNYTNEIITIKSILQMNNIT